MHRRGTDDGQTGRFGVIVVAYSVPYAALAGGGLLYYRAVQVVLDGRWMVSRVGGLQVRRRRRVPWMDEEEVMVCSVLVWVVSMCVTIPRIWSKPCA